MKGRSFIQRVAAAFLGLLLVFLLLPPGGVFSQEGEVANCILPKQVVRFLAKNRWC